VRLPSYAKINLCLHVLRKREDNYHEIETVFQQIDIRDEITLQPRQDDLQLFCDHPNVPTDDRNLCLKAAKLLQQRCHTKLGCSIYLHKQIPIASGLGGGSSNAAVTLMGLNVLWELGLTKRDLFKISTEIGSDVPFFIEGGTALGTGRGELITCLKTKFKYWVVIISPSIEISSKWAYQSSNFNLTNTEKNCKLSTLKKSQSLPNRWQINFHNDLESLVFEKFRKLKTIRDQLEQQGAVFALMSGSGPCIFGLFHSQEEALHIKKSMGSDLKSFVVKPIKWGYAELIDQI